MQRSSLANDKMNETGSQPGKRGDFAMNGKKSLFVFMIILGAVMAYVQPAEAVNRYWVAASAGNWSNTANWSNATGGAGGQPVPVAGDTANFDSGGAGTCTLDTSPTVTAINMASTFAGTFDLSSSTLTVSGGFTFSGGTLTASTSTVILSGGSSTVTGNITFYNLTINGTSGADKTVANSNTLTVNNTLVLTVGRLVQATVPAAGTIAAKGDITQASTFAGASSAPAGASVVISGSGNQTFTGSATSTTGDMPVVTINKSSGTLFLSGIIRTTHHWNYTAGTLDVTTNSNKVVFAGSGSLKVTGSHTLRDVEFYAGDGLTIYIADNNTLTVSRTLTLTDGKLAQTTVPAAGSIIAQGDIIQASTYDGSYSAGVTIVVSGTGNQTFTGSATSTTGDMPAVTINKSSGTLFLSGTIRTTRAWTYTAGTLDVTTNSNKVVFAGGGLTITGSHTLRDVEIYLNSSTCTIANNNTLTVSGTLTLTGGSLTQTTVPAAGTIAAQGDITVASTWNGAGGGGPGTIVISGTGNQTLTGSATSTVGNLAKLTINKSSGTLTLAGTIRTSNNWTYTAGTLDAGTSTVVFVPTGSGLTMAGNHSLYNVRIDSNSATNSFILTVPATLTVLGTLTFGNSSTGSINVNGGAINANGNITVENNVNYGGGAATLTINGNGNQALTGSATSTTGNIPAVTINKSSGTLTLAGTIRTSNNWTYTAGTLDAGTSTVVFVPTASPGLTIAGNHSLYNVRIDSNSATNSFILTVPATLTVLGTLTFGNSSTGSINVNGGAINANGNITVENNVNYGGGAATLTINGTGNQIVTGPSSGTTTIPSITVSKSSGSILLGSTVNFGGSQNLTINSTTTLDLAGYPLTVGGTLTNNGIILASGGGTPITAGVFNSSAASNFTYSSTGSAGAVTMAPGTYGNLSVNKTGAVFSLGGNSTVLGNLNITAGTLDASTNNYSLTVGGNWANTDIFNGRAGSVTLNGTGQGLTGSNTFFNFTKLVTTLDIFTLPAGKTTTIQGALTLQGVAGNPLALRSSTAGIQAKLTLVTGGTQSLLQLDVQDSDASAGQLLIAYNSSNSGNNLNWSFQTLDLNAGLLSYWKFDNDTADSKGTRNGALNGATFTTGKAPTTYANTYALSFNGSSNTMTASGSGLPAANAPQSFGLWAKPTSTIGALFSLWNAGSSSAVFLFANATVKNYARSNLVAGSAPSTGVWHYYAYTYDGTTHKIYIDGTLNASATTAADTATPNNVVIGNTGTGTDAPFNGTADDVRVYNRALSQTEVSLLSQQAGINGTGTLTLKNPTTLSTTTTNTATVTAALASLETGSPNATKYALSNTINSFPASVAIPGAPIASYSSTYTVPTGDGGKVVYAKITLSDSTTYTVTSNAITLDTVPPSAPTNLTLTANSDNTGFTATVTAPSSSDVTKLYWRYNVLDGNVAPSYPTSNASGTALGAGVTTGVTASSSQSITVTSMTQLKTYCVAVWAEDTAGNVSLLSAQNYLYLAPPTPRLVITAATSTAAAQAGGSTILTITAKDANNAVISTYAGPYTLTWTPTGGSATTLVSSSSSGWSGGATTASVSIGGSSAGTGTFNATDNSGTALTNGTLSFTWYPASFTVSTSSTSQVAGKGFTLTVTANDSAGSVVTPYVGTVSLTISATPTATDGLSVSSLSVTGAGVGSVTTSYPKWASAATITAKDTTYVSGVTIQGTGSSLRFNPDKFTVTVDPPPPSRLVYYLNELFRSVKVTALAADGTKLTNYQGTITFQTVSGLSLPSNYIFTAADGGLHEFTTGIMATTPGIYAGLTVSDTIATSAAGTSGPVTVIRAKVIIAYVDGPVGRLIVPVRIIDEVGNIIFGDSSTLLALTLTEGNPNGSATVPSLQIPFSSGELGIALTDTEAEKVRVGGSTSPVSLPIVEGVVTFGSSSTSQYSSSFQYIQFEQAPTSSPIGTYASQPLYAPSAGYVAQTSSAIPPAGSYSSPQGIAQYVSPANLTPAGRYDTGVSSGLSALQGFYAGQGSVAGSSYSPGNSSLPASSTISGYTPQAGFLGPTSNAPASYGQSFSPAAFQAATAGLPPSMVSAMQTYMTNKQTNAGSMNSYYGFYGPASFDRGSAGSSSPFGNFGMAGGAFMGQGTSPGTSNSNNAFSPAAFQTATAGLPPSMVSAMQSYMANTGRPVQVAPMSAYSPSATGNFGPPAGGGAEGNFSPTASWGAGFFGPANSSANADNAPSASSAVGNVQQGLAPIGPASFSFGNFEVPSSMNVAQGISAGQPGSSSPWGGGFSSGNAANPSEGMKVGNMPPWMEGFTPDTAHGPSWAEGGSHNNEEEKSGQGQKETSSQGQGNVAVGESTK